MIHGPEATWDFYREAQEPWKDAVLLIGEPIDAGPGVESGAQSRENESGHLSDLPATHGCLSSLAGVRGLYHAALARYSQAGPMSYRVVRSLSC